MTTQFNIRFITLAAVLLIALPIGVPAPMSEQEMGFNDNLPIEEQANRLEEFHRRDQQTRTQVLAEAAEAGEVRRVARTASIPVPPEAAIEVAARSRQTRADHLAQATPAAIQPAEPHGNSAMWFITIGLIAALVGWGIWLFRRFGKPATS